MDRNEQFPLMNLSDVKFMEAFNATAKESRCQKCTQLRRIHKKNYLIFCLKCEKEILKKVT